MGLGGGDQAFMQLSRRRKKAMIKRPNGEQG
jgi:hypothetical protein